MAIMEGVIQFDLDAEAADSKAGKAWTLAQVIHARITDIKESIPVNDPAPAKGLMSLEKPEPSIQNLVALQNTLNYFRDWGQNLPDLVRISFLELITDMQKFSVHEWTEVDEALLRVGTAMAMLKRFRGYPTHE